MELENLFTKLKSQEETKEHFLALEITSSFVWAAVWQAAEEKPKIKAFGRREKWDGQKLESLTAASDASLASALEDLPEEPNKVIFGLPEIWVSEDKIVKPRQVDLKALCQKLDLQPLGFVVTTEAIIQYLKKTEGTPLSGILINPGKEEVSLTLVQAGKNLGTQAIGRSENLTEDINEGLARFSQEESFPSRILLYDGQELEAAQQSLLEFEWPAQTFLHFPKVEVLEDGLSLKAVTIAGGEEVAESLGLKKEAVAEEFGFVQGEDVLAKTEAQPSAEKMPEAPRKMVLPKIKLPRLPLSGWKFKLPGLRLGRNKRLALIISVALFFILGLGAAATALYWSYPKALVVIFVEAKTLEKELVIGIDPDLSAVDSQEQQIPGESVEAETTVNQQREASGEKLIGEKAKGEITIHNFTASGRTFTKGTTVVGPGNLEFALDVDVTVASASSSFNEGWQEVITPGKTQVVITAEQVGPEYNLAGDSEFEIKGLATASYRAKNSKALSGGASRQVKVVSGADQAALLESLTTEAEAKIIEALKSQAPAAKKILDQGILTTVVNQEFSQAVGSEAETVSLAMTMKAKTLAYSTDDLETLLAEMITDSVPEGFVIKELTTSIEESKITKEGEAVINLNLKADLGPDFDLEEIKRNLSGKYPQVGEEYLESLSSFIRADISIQPKLPARLQTFPRLVKNIKVEIKVKD